MVATTACIDLWRPAELAHPNDQCFVEQPAIGKVLQQRRIREVHRRHQCFLQALAVLGMRVPSGRNCVVVLPTCPIDMNEGNTCFDQSSRQQHALSEPISPVAFANFIGFLLNGKRSSRFRLTQQIEGFLAQTIPAMHRAGA